MLNDLKNFDVNRCLDPDQLVALAAQGRILRDEYEKHQLEAPEWLDVNLKSIHREIRARNVDRIEKQLREKKARLDALKSPTQRTQEIKKEIRDLEEQLAGIGS
jgi:hypothetical protein